jgi:uncharacterized protein (TIGR02996 family)
VFVVNVTCSGGSAARYERQLASCAFRLGSDPACEVVVIADRAVAACHLQVHVRLHDLAVVVVPQGETRINGVAVSAPTHVTHKDVIEIGETAVWLEVCKRPDTPPGPALVDRIDWRASVVDVAPPYPPAEPLPPITDYLSPMGTAILAPVRTLDLAADPVGLGLLAELGNDPADTTTRMVYADHLEAMGYPLHAAFVRSGTEAVHARRFPRSCDLAWRTLVAASRIEPYQRRSRCLRGSHCPGTWDRFAITSDAGVRRCDACDRDVHYCATLADHDAARDAEVVLDPGLERNVLARHVRQEAR